METDTQALYNNPTHSDITLKGPDGVQIRAHKLIIAKSGLLSRTSRESYISGLWLDDPILTRESLEFCIQHLYGIDGPPANWEHALVGAEYLEIRSLINHLYMSAPPSHFGRAFEHAAICKNAALLRKCAKQLEQYVENGQFGQYVAQLKTCSAEVIVRIGCAIVDNIGGVTALAVICSWEYDNKGTGSALTEFIRTRGGIKNDMRLMQNFPILRDSLILKVSYPVFDGPYFPSPYNHQLIKWADSCK